MIHFLWWWMIFALPLPVLTYRLLPRSEAGYAALKAPFLGLFPENEINQGRAGRLLGLLAIMTWLVLVVAAMRPQWVGDPVPTAVAGRDLMLAVDLSDSMKARDMQISGQRVNRLQAVQAIAGEFIERRQGDRLGLILFGSEAYLQTPLTLDRRTVKSLLDEAVIGIAGQKTAIGDAIALAAKRLRKREADKVLILLTDGENTAGRISPQQALEAARKIGLKIYTIGIGQGPSDTFSSFFSGRSGVDERALKQIASATGGTYFRARNSAELAQIYAQIDRLEAAEEEIDTLRPIRELFHWPAALALLLASVLFWGKARWTT